MSSASEHRSVNLQELPRFSDGWTFVYAEQCRVSRHAHGIQLQDDKGVVDIPASVVSCLVLGPGSTLTHHGAMVLAENGCSIVWSGQGATRWYAAGMGETRSASNLLHQAHHVSDPERRLAVVRRMYAMRFDEELDESLTLEQIRGKEGVRVREAYRRASDESGIPWSGRNYKPGEWGNADPVNRALSGANACLYALCHAAIVSVGFSPGLGFIHTGKMLSFVYDIADLYKVEMTVPLAFDLVRLGTAELDQRVRRSCRDMFFRRGLLARIVPDMQVALGMRPVKSRLLVLGDPTDPESPSGLWDPERGLVEHGRNWGDVESRSEDPPVLQ